MPLTEEEKMIIIEQALMIDEGRTAFAHTWDQSIPSYNEIAKKIILEKNEPIDSRFDILDL